MKNNCYTVCAQFVLFTGLLSAQAQQPRTVQTLADPGRLTALEFRLDEDSLLKEALHERPALAAGTPDRFAANNIQVGNQKSLSVPEVARNLFADHVAAETQLRRIQPRALARPIQTEEKVFEMPDSYVFARTTVVVVSDPAQAAADSPLFKDYLAEPGRAGTLRPGDLQAEERAGLENFMRNELPALPADDPIAVAAREGGEQGVLDAIAAGKGTLEITDTFEIPKHILPVVNQGVQVPDVSGAIFRASSARTMQSDIFRTFSALPGQDALNRRVHTGTAPEVNYEPRERATYEADGSRRFTAEFLSGFTKGNAWKWEKRWSYPSGFFRVTLGAGYGVGLRVPIQVKGSIKPTEINVRAASDPHVSYSTTLNVATLDADPDFYERTGLARDKIFEGKEGVFEFHCYYGYKFRALWMDILHKRKTEVASFSRSQNWQPPLGNAGSVLRFEIPPELTNTKFDFAVMSGYVQLAMSLTGTGAVHLDYQSLIDGQEGPKRGLVFRSNAAQTRVEDLPQLTATLNQTRTQTYGFRLSGPSYSLEARLVPEVKASVRVGYHSVSKSFSTGWISLNALAVDLGTIHLGPHAGTHTNFVFNEGKKSFTNINAAPSTGANAGPFTEQARIPAASRRVAIRCVQNGKYVRAGWGTDCELVATSSRIGGWETFDWIDLPGGKVVLQSVQNGMLVRAGNGPRCLVNALSQNIGGWESFRIQQLGQGHVGFYCVQNNRYLRAGVPPNNNLTATSQFAHAWETFEVIPVGGAPRR